MYLYFDKNGVLLEVINDEALRRYNNQVNTMYIYIDDSPYKIRDLEYWFELPNGDSTEVYSFLIHEDVKVVEKIPFDNKRDLKHFEYGVDYEMYKIPIPSGKQIADTNEYEYNVFAESGQVAVALRIIYDTDAIKELTLGKVIFTIEDEVVLPTDTITVSQFEYLLNTVSRAIEANKDYNNLENKPSINGVTLQGDKSATELRLVPTSLSSFERLSAITRDVRLKVELFVDNKANGAKITLQDVKEMNTKIVVTENVGDVDMSKLEVGDFIYEIK